MKLVLLRHGVTDWNLEKRIQGRIDRPLCAQGREQLTRMTLPAALTDYHWYCSPLLRARQSAALLGLTEVTVEPLLIEMNWGDWEGEVLKPLRRRLGDEMRRNECRGIDFCPPGGESPRQVQARLQPWLKRISASGSDSAAVVHKGIIRCIYALASGWDMRAATPVDFAWNQFHQFELTPGGELLDSYQSIALVEKTQ